MLRKCLKQGLWEDTQLQCKQLSGIGPLLSSRLRAAGLSSLAQLQIADPRRIENVCQKHFPFGA